MPVEALDPGSAESVGEHRRKVTRERDADGALRSSKEVVTRRPSSAPFAMTLRQAWSIPLPLPIRDPRKGSPTRDRLRYPHRIERLAIVEPQDLGALRRRHRDRRKRRRASLVRAGPASQDPARTAPRIILARDRRHHRPSKFLKLRIRPTSAIVSSTPLSKSGPGVDGDLLGRDPCRGHALDPLREPALQVGDDIAVDRRCAVGARRARDVHQDVAAPRSAISSNISSDPPEMSLIATAPASSAARATSGWKVSAMTGTPARSQGPQSRA